MGQQAIPHLRFILERPGDRQFPPVVLHPGVFQIREFDGGGFEQRLELVLRVKNAEGFFPSERFQLLEQVGWVNPHLAGAHHLVGAREPLDYKARLGMDGGKVERGGFDHRLAGQDFQVSPRGRAEWNCRRRTGLGEACAQFLAEGRLAGVMPGEGDRPCVSAEDLLGLRDRQEL